MLGKNASILNLFILVPLSSVGGLDVHTYQADHDAFSDEVIMLQSSVKTSPGRHLTKKRSRVVKEAPVDSSSHSGVSSQVSQQRLTFQPAVITAAPAYVAMVLSCLALFVAGLKAKEQPQQPQTHEDAPPPRANNQWAVASESVEAMDVPTPTPTGRLDKISSTFNVPIRNIGQCRASELVFDVPTVPTAYSYHAAFSRLDDGSWEKISLSSKFDSAGDPESPQITLKCQRCTEDGGETGGTGFAAIDANLGNMSESASDEDGLPWLEISANDETLVAVVVRKQGNKVALRKPEQAPWDVEVRLEHGTRGINVFNHGQEIGRAEALDRKRQVTTGRMDSLQVDTKFEANSQDAALILMCMLAMHTF